MMKVLMFLATITTVVFINGVQGQFFGRTETGSFYSGNHVNSDIAEEKREIRLANEAFIELADTIVSDFLLDNENAEYDTWKERGSSYLADGVTPIVENEDYGSSQTDPSVRIGFGDPLTKRKFDVNMDYDRFGNPTVSNALNDHEMESITSGWILMESKGSVYSNNSRADEFISLLNVNEKKIIRVVCESCVPSHKEIFYRRMTPAPVDLFDIIANNWRSSDNNHGVDFELYSTYNDAINGENAWTFCDGFDVQDQGFPGSCGPSNKVEDQWINIGKEIGQPDVAIFVQNSTASDDLFQTADWVVELEEYLSTNPTEAKARGFCWHLPLRDTRQECWWACKYGENTDDLGALKLCYNLRHKGQIYKYMNFAKDSDSVDGLEGDHKIKDTHALGVDINLPSLGTY